jgi:hypothetical protein
MNQTYKILFLAIYFFLLFFFIPRPVSAYIGPGTMTLAFQILAGLLVGGVTVIAMYWSKIKSKIFKKNKSK